jgi:LmbE family N-acetylglucosaminyl deacetylase
MMAGTGATRKEFLLALAGGAVLPAPIEAQTQSASGNKLLIVVAHPDDEYAFAATAYRLVRELGWIADQVIVTDGESGYRYSTLAEVFYGTQWTNPADARSNLPKIRKEEAARAGNILGIRRHYFLEQKDLGFESDPAAADTSNWDRAFVDARISSLLERERYAVVLTLLPTAETHGHHRAATIAALSAVEKMEVANRPLIFGAEPRAKSAAERSFVGLASEPLTATHSAVPAFTFDRTTTFGYRSALDYRIVVNWVIAEHKSQGLFQTQFGVDQLEQFWLFRASGDATAPRTAGFSAAFGVGPSWQESHRF